MAGNSHQISNFSRKHTIAWVLHGCFLLWHHQRVIVYVLSINYHLKSDIGLSTFLTVQAQHWNPLNSEHLLVSLIKSWQKISMAHLRTCESSKSHILPSLQWKAFNSCWKIVQTCKKSPIWPRFQQSIGMSCLH